LITKSALLRVKGRFNNLSLTCVHAPTVGKYGLHTDSNDNGLRLIGLANALNMAFGSTTFLHKNIHLTIWKSSDGKTTY
jgi:hypothetical protein